MITVVLMLTAICLFSIRNLSNNQITTIEERICDNLCNLSQM